MEGWIRAFVGSALMVGALGSVAGSADEAGLKTPSPTKLQEECLRYRDEITRHGYVYLHRATESYGASGGERSETEFRIWFSDDRLRFDQRRLGKEGDWPDWEHYVVDGERYTWIPAGEFEGVVAPVSEYGHEQGGVIGHFCLFHPRWLGMGQNAEAAMQLNPAYCFVNPRITKAKCTVVAEEKNGLRTWRVTRETSFPGETPEAPRIPGEFVMWFAPEAGGSLVRAELRELKKDYTYVRSVESPLKQYPDRGFWFPGEVIRETTVKGRVTRREVITVREAVLGRRPDEQQFQVAGMELPEGKQISDRSRGPWETVLVWDGREAVPVRGPGAAMAEGPAPRRSTWLMAINAIVLGVLGICCMVWLLLRRAASRKG